MDTLSKINLRAQGRADRRTIANVVSHAWLQALAIVGASWIVVFFLFPGTVIATIDQWQRSQTYSHGFLVFPITMYLIWRERDQITLLIPKQNYWGLPILAMLGMGWLLGHLGAALVVQQIAVVAMLQALVLTIVGWPVTRSVFFPLFFLVFAVPFGEDLVRPLQHYTAAFAVRGLQLTGIPVFREGWLILTPSGIFEIAETCAGVRYVIPAVILGCLFSYGCYRSWGRRLGFVLFCFLAAVVANGMRAYGIIVIAYLTNNRYAVGVDHIIGGWVFHSVLVLLLFWIGLRWREPTTVASRVAADASESNAEVIRSAWSKAMVLPALSGLAILGLAPLAAQYLTQPPSEVAPPIISSPAVKQPWHALEKHDAQWKPSFLGADVELLKRYVKDGTVVDLFMAYYGPHQRQGAELISGANVLIDLTNWLVVEARKARIVVDGKSFAGDELVIRSNQGTRLLWNWYWVGGTFTSNHYFVKILELRGRLLREQTGSAVIAVAAQVDNGKLIEATDTIQDFLHHLELGQALSPPTK